VGISTTQSSTSFAIVSSTYEETPARKAQRTDCYVQLYYQQYRDQIKIVNRLRYDAPAPWLTDVKRRIRNSIAKLVPGESAGTVIRNEIADVALWFFERFSAELPKEPFISSSLQGDLVAEFYDEHEPLTMIFSDKFVIVFGSLRGDPVELKVDITSPSNLDNPTLIKRLRAGSYGSVATAT
jgi:hypothetical protein